MEGDRLLTLAREDDVIPRLPYAPPALRFVQQIRVSRLEALQIRARHGRLRDY